MVRTKCRKLNIFLPPQLKNSVIHIRMFGLTDFLVVMLSWPLACALPTLNYSPLAMHIPAI